MKTVRMVIFCRLFLIIVCAVFLCLAAGCRSYDIIGGPVQENDLSDGVYKGHSRQGPVRVTVEVTVHNQKVKNIDIVRHAHRRGEDAEQPVIEKIIREQSTSVDTVTGATASSIAIMNAVEDALHKARK